SACSSCQVKGACNLSDMQEKFIEVPTTGNQLHKPGETVTVAMRESLGTKAVLLVYIVPFVIVLLSLFLFATITGSELQAGLISLLLLIPYYSIIYALRKRLEKTFIFEIKD
ncbi:MAG: SoxR reducing system RseC family protein, partial [Bacteroidales bacterium]|nr:SoxR reducing system RseC family protein [Bacteroidales bacterium]